MSPDFLVLTRFAPSFVEEEPVHRQRLLARIQGGPDVRLVVVQAPAGSGKTTLLYDYVRSSPTPVAWLSLQETDRDQRMFCAYLVEALARRYADTPFSSRQLVAASSPTPASAEAILVALVNDLFNAPGTQELVLDDLHFLNGHPAALESLSFLVSQSPRGFRVLATTRESPPSALRLAHLRSKGAALLVTPEDLRFTRTEIAQLVRRRWPQGASDAAIDQLYAKTEGWVTGVELLHQSLMDCSAAVVTRHLEHLERGTGVIFDYLAEEILSRQSPQTRLFLLTTSILETFDMAVARVASGLADAAEVLRKVEESGLFLVHLDDQSLRFRYHHLFSDFLRSTLAREIGPAGLADLHRRVSHWYETHDDIRSALHHSMACADTTQAAAMLAQYGEAVIKQGQVVLVQRWLAQLGEPVVRAHHDLLLLRGQVNELQGNWVGATQDYELILGSEDAPALQAQVLERLALCCANYGQMERMEQYVDEAIAHCPPDDVAMKARIYHWFGASLVISGRDWSRGYGMLRECYQLARVSHDPGTIASACMAYGFVYHFSQGNLAEAEKTLAEGIELCERMGRTYEAYHLMVNRAVVVLFLGSLERAFVLLEQVRAVTTMFPNSFAHLAYEQTLSKAYLDARDLPRCRYHLEQLRLQEIPFQLKPWYQRTFLLLCLLEGNLEQATVAGLEIADLLKLEGPGLYAPECLWALSLLLRRHGELEEAHRRLTESLRLAGEAQAKYWQMKAHAGLAAIHLLCKETKKLQSHLASALKLSRENSYDAFWAADLACDTCALALEAVALHIEEGYATQLLVQQGARFLDELPTLLNKAPAARHTAACLVLGSIGHPRAADMLGHIGRSKIHGVRRAAHQAMVQIKGEGTLRIHALGSFQILRGEQVIQLSPNRRMVFKLLKYLLCYYGRVCLDDQLIDALWPDANSGNGAGRLQTHVSWLRDFLDPGREVGKEDRFIARVGQGYRLQNDVDLWLDVRAFEEAFAEAERLQRTDSPQKALGQWERTCIIYRGELLSDDLYDDWCVARRTELADKQAMTMRRTAELYASLGRHQEAISQYQCVLQIDPYTETAYRQIVRSYLALGDRAAALRSVRTFMETIGATPSLEDFGKLLAELQTTDTS